MTALDPRALRTAFGRFMTGVTVVTTCAPDGTPHGFTANSFSSVSLDPPLLLVCPGKFLSSFQVFADCTHFAVSILAEGQKDISNTFAGFKGDRFAQVRHGPDRNGVPLIDGAVAQFSCTTWQSLPAGDHQVLIGRVTEFNQTDAPGLGYVGGRYFGLGLERAAMDQSDSQSICGVIIAQGDCVLLERTPHGYRPPQATVTDRGRVRRDLQDALLAQGLPVDLGPAYSVYDDADSRNHHTYFLASSTAAPGEGIEAVPVTSLKTLTYTTPAIAEMMTRYALECRTRGFGLYIGDATRGDVHSLTERT